MQTVKETIFKFLQMSIILFLVLGSCCCYAVATAQNIRTGEEGEGDDDLALGEAMDSSLSFLSSSSNPSNNTFCVQNIKELMTRNGIASSARYLKNNLTDAQILRLGMLASIALISPWSQNAQGKLVITDRGILVEDNRPSSSESDIMLCIVCTLLAIIVLFHVTSAQQQYVMSQPAAASSTEGEKDTSLKK